MKFLVLKKKGINFVFVLAWLKEVENQREEISELERMGCEVQWAPWAQYRLS
jgi:hypothetical protein